MKTMTSNVESALRDAVSRLAETGIDSPRLDAELLMASVLEIPRGRLPARGDTPLPPDAAAEFEAFIAERARRVPVAYLLGVREFRGLSFLVDRRVLVPRPETEILVDEALRLLSASAEREGLLRPRRVADLGTGSGCVALALARAVDAEEIRPLPRTLDVVAVDVSRDALDVALVNAGRHPCSSRIEFLLGDGWAPIESLGLAAGFDLVLSNPPYVSDAEYAALPPDIRVFEPAVALRGGPDGSDLLRRWIEGAPRFLRSGGHLAVEASPGHASLLPDLARRTGAYSHVHWVEDLAGRPRVFVARRW